MRQIKVGMLVSYDYEMIKNSLPPIYDHADKIVLAVDKDGKTWAGNDIHISDDFWQWLKDFDTQHKIEIYRDSFYVDGLTAMQCDTRERAMLAKYMGDGGWHIQVDSDEYFVDFKHFVDFLHYLDTRKRYINCVIIEWLILFKRTSKGFLIIKDNGGYIHLATTKPQHRGTCRTMIRPHAILYSQKIIHDSWARTEDEMLVKLNNWGHNTDFDTDGYFHYWKAINEKNYMFIKNFHPLQNDTWQGLNYIEANNIHDMLFYLKKTENKELLQAKPIQTKLKKFLYLCIPPVFSKINKYLKNKKV